MTKKRILMVLLTVMSAMLFCACSVAQSQIELREEGIALMEEGKYADAAECFSQALLLSRGTITETEIDLCYYKAAALYNAKEFEKAADVYTALIKYQPKAYVPYLFRGSIYASEGEIEKAIADYKCAIKENPNDYNLYIEIYQNLNALEYRQEGIEFLNYALELGKDDGKSHMNRGRIYFLLQQYDQAVAELTIAVDKGTDEANVYLAQIYRMQGDDVTAQSLLTDYLASDSADSTALGEMGDLEMENGNYELALGYYETGLKDDSIDNYSQLLKGRISALEHLGRFPEAKEALAQYLENYPNDEAAQREQLFLSSR